MSEFINAVSAVFLIFSMMAVGYLMGHIGWMTGSEKKFISRFVVNVAHQVSHRHHGQYQKDGGYRVYKFRHVF